ncbi:MAG: PAS domain S-box protein [Methylotenera sp.]
MGLSRKLIFIVLSSVALVTIPATVGLYYYYKDKLLDKEAKVLQADTDINISNVFKPIVQEEARLNFLSQLLEKDLAALPESTGVKLFDDMMQRNDDGAWRSKPEANDSGRQTGVFLPPDAKLDAKQKSILLRSKKIIDSAAFGLNSYFNNLWLITHDKAEVISDSLTPDFILQMPADTDYTKTAWMTLGDPATNPNREMRWTESTYDPVPKTWMISAVKPVDVNGVWIGNIGQDMFLQNLFAVLFKKTQRYRGELFFLLDEHGHYLQAGPWQQALEVNPDKFKPDFSQAPLLEKLFKQKLGGGAQVSEQQVSIKGRNYLAISTMVKPMNWRYYRLVPVNAILVSLNNLFITLGIAVVLIGLFIGFLIRKAIEDIIFSRFRTLARKVYRQAPVGFVPLTSLSLLNQGNASLTIKPQTDDDINLASQGFDVALDLLKESERELQLLMDNMPATVARVNRDLRYEFVNKNYELVFGKSPTWIIGRTMLELQGEAMFKQAEPYVQRALAGERCSYERVAKTPSGVSFTGLVHLIPNRDVNQHVIGLFVVGIDITQVKKAEAENEASSNFLKTIIDVAPLQIFWKDTNSRYMGGNLAFAKDALLNSSEDLVGKFDTDLLWKDSAEKFQREDQEIIESGIAKLNYEHMLVRPSGEITWAKSSKVPLRNHNNEIIGVLGVDEDITERKLLEEARMEALQRIQKIASNVPGIVYQFLLRKDGSSCFPYASEAINYIFRVSPEEVCEDASIVFARIHPDDYDDILISIQISAKDLTLWNEEFRVKYEDGTERWLFGNSSPELQENGAVLWHGFITDITEQKRIEKELAGSEARWQYALEGAGDAVWDCDEVSHTMHYSKAWKKILGYSEGEITDSYDEWESRIHPEDLEATLAVAQACLDGKSTSFVSEYRSRCKDGSYKWVLDRGAVVSRSEDGAPLRMIGTVSDITERKKTEQALVDSEYRWKFAVEGSGDGVWDVNVQTQEANYSKRWKEMLGYEEDELMANRQEWISRIHPDDRSNVLDSGQAYLEGKTDSYVVEYRLQCKGGQYKWMLSRGMLVSRDEADKPLRMIGTQTDITESKQSELKIKRLSNLYEALSQCNLAIVHCTSKEELFAQVCRDTVIFGGLRMAWIGLVDVPSKQIKQVAAYGDDCDYLNDINVSVDADIPYGQGPVGTSIRENTPYWCQDFINDPRTLAWHDRGIASGWGSCASLPLYCSGDAIGAFTIYSTEKEAFDEEIRNLLNDMATNISFALDNFEREAERLLAQDKLVQAQAELAESHDRFKDLYEFAPIGYLTISKHGLITQLNWRASAMLGLDRKHIINQRITKFIDEEEKPRWGRLFHNIVDLEASEELSFDMKFTLHNGISFYANLNCIRMGDEDEQSMLRVTLEDVTLVKKSEMDLRIAATAFESQDGLMITDLDNRILKVNKAFTDITGYTNDELIGKNPSILSSGRHDATFYAAIWESINTTGRWSGEVWNRRKSGEVYPEHLTISTVKNDLGVITNYVASNTDISQIKAATEEIQQLAFFDSLTHLPNRRLLMDRLKHALAACARSGRQGAVLFLDLDHFKVLNDSLGHDIGDLLLQQVAVRLTTCVREGDTVARLGGDEYVVVLEDLSDQGFEAAAQTEIIANKILASLNQPFELDIHEHLITPSIGITVFDGHGATIEELLKQADIAMYQAKKAGRNTMRFFNPQMQISITARVAIERELRKALENKQLHLYYQIQVDNLGNPLGAEALIRWIHPERGIVSPAQFIPLAEETGLILPIGNWVLDTACAQIKEWHKDPQTRDLTLSINVSAKQFRQTDFVQQVRAAVERHAIDPMQLKLELTESLLLDNIEDTVVSMTALGEIGVQFSLDDFGTGYSSLQYLKRLPLFQLKIDQSFVRDIVTDSHDRSIVRTIIAMAQSLYLNVIAEGVETEEQRALLLSNGCKRYQGYLFSKPVPIEQFEAVLKQITTKDSSKPNVEHI